MAAKKKEEERRRSRVLRNTAPLITFPTTPAGEGQAHSLQVVNLIVIHGKPILVYDVGEGESGNPWGPKF